MLKINELKKVQVEKSLGFFLFFSQNGAKWGKKWKKPTPLQYTVNRLNHRDFTRLYKLKNAVKW